MTSRPLRAHPFVQLLLARMRETLREPEVIFWVFGFPVLLAVGLGLAFRNQAPDSLPVAVVDGEAASAVLAALAADPGLAGERLPAPEAARALRLGKVALVVVPGTPPAVRYDPSRPDALLARARVLDRLQAAAGRSDAVAVIEHTESEPGARYIDFLIPGLLGMNIMSGGMWGVGFHVVDMRTRKLLRRLVATPMRKGHFMGAILASRVVLITAELALLLALGRWLFAMAIPGSLAAIALVALLGGFVFAGLGLLVAARAAKIETVSGLMNVVMLPMFVASGIFFSSARFPAPAQPFIQALPLTALNDALRATILEGASLGSQLGEIGILAAWGALSFGLALRFFRWT